MKFKTRERYTMRMMMSIASLSSDHSPVGLGQVARHSGISRKYLEQLVLPLKNAKLIRSTTGRDGGYFLAKRPEHIRLGDILSAAVGKIAVTDCAIGEEDCTKSMHCNCKSLWTLINHKIVQTLNEHSLSDLLKDNWSSTVENQIESRGKNE